MIIEAGSIWVGNVLVYEVTSFVYVAILDVTF